MSKRRLTRRQAWRVEQIQDERRSRLQRASAKGEAMLAGDGLGPEQLGQVVANHGANVSIRDEQGRASKAFVRSNLELPVAGDQVVWRQAEDGNGVVVALQPRSSLLSRPNRRGDPHPLAANVDLMVVVGAPQPILDLNLIDRYLVAAETLSIPPAILVNKDDLIDPAQRLQLEAALDDYRRIGYPTLFASAKREHGLQQLTRHLDGRTSVLVGQSGVGKSSIINHLLPVQPAQEGELTRGFGRHTTSTTMLYQLPSGGQLIDSPGVRRFSLWHLPPQAVAAGFSEIRPLLGQCRFRDCRHQQEPGCALHAAVEAREISQRRLQSYFRILADDAE